jgi:Uma2 family endonuclease
MTQALYARAVRRHKRADFTYTQRLKARTEQGKRLYLPRRYTYQDYLSWPEDFRAEIVDGEIYTMPAPTSNHQRIITKLMHLLYDAVEKQGGEIFPAPLSVRLFPEVDAKDENVFEPDIVVVCNKNKIEKRGVVGAPDMIVEVSSPSTALYDANTKMDKYEKAGVREYWMVNMEEKNVRVNILVNGEYKEHIYSTGETITLTALPDTRVEVSKIFA